MKPRHEFERTCKRDGTVWYVSLKAAAERAPSRLTMVGAGMQASGARMSLSSRTKAGAATQSLQLELKAERVAKTNSCPSCGSQSFTSKKVRVK